MNSLKRIVIFLVIVFLFTGCSSRKKYWQEYKEDGIEFLDEDEPGKKANKKTNENKEETNQENVKSSANAKPTSAEGITFLDSGELFTKNSAPKRKNGSKVETGKASFYSDKLHGRKTASGEAYDRNKMTAAHRTLKFGTKVKVTNLKNNRSVIVRINDRGPSIKSRIIDLSYAAAKKIGIIETGIADVSMQVVGE